MLRPLFQSVVLTSSLALTALPSLAHASLPMCDRDPGRAREDGYFVSGDEAKERGGVGNYVPAKPCPPAEQIQHAAAEVPPPQTPPPSRHEQAGATEALGPSSWVLYFDTASAQIRPEDRQTLQNLKELLQSDKNLKVEIQGYADPRGPAPFNLELSQRRADSVQGWLETQGVPADQLETQAFGESKAPAKEPPAQYAEERRVVIQKVRG